MALARFKTTTETHNQLSCLVNTVHEKGTVIFITSHGIPRYAFLPLEEIDKKAAERTIGIRELAKDFHQFLKKLDKWEELYITSHKKPIAQLVLIDPDDVDDMIVAASKQIQSEAEKYNTPEAASKLVSGSALLDELKALRNQAHTKNR